MRRPLTTALALACLSSLAHAQITHWRAVKGPGYWQLKNNAAATKADGWFADIYVVTTNAGDAKAINLSGGGITGNLALTRDGNEWFLERDFKTQGALSALFPSTGTYTITMSGGTLGTKTQKFTWGTEAYPNVPYLTNNSFLTALAYPEKVAVPLSWNHPGTRTQTSGSTILEIFDDKDNEAFAA